MNNKNVFLLFHLLLLLLITLLPMSSSAQNSAGGIKVSGKVLDNNKNEIIGATIILKGTNVGISSDVYGNFELSVPTESSTLVVSYIGYESREIVVGSLRKMTVTLLEGHTSLEEVVVIAYGTQKKETLTGAVASVGSKELLASPVSDVTNILAGKMPGVTTIQNSGQPGADNAQIFIRGAGSLSSGASAPLVLVDGIERSFSDIDPNEIESLSILKDASSTAVFGVRGANGVILVTTRRGKTGAAKISVSSTIGIQRPMSYVKQANSYEYAKFWNMKNYNDGITSGPTNFSRDAIEAYRTGNQPIMYPSTDWGEMMFNDVFLQTQNNVNISGGSEDVQYFVSLGFLHKNGVLKQLPGLDYDNNYSYNRYNFRTNLDFKLSPTTKMKFNVGGNVGKINEPHVIEDIDNPWVYANIWAVPMSSPGMINGVRTFAPPSFIPEVELRDGLGAFYGYGYKEKYDLKLNVDVEIIQDLSSLVEGLEFGVKGGYDNRFRLEKSRKGYGVETQNVYYKSHLENDGLAHDHPDYDRTLVYVPSGSNRPLVYSDDSGRDRNWYFDLRLNYSKSFGEHTISALALYNQSKNYYPDVPDYLNPVIKERLTNMQYIPRSYSGLVGRVTYDYGSKYLADFSMGYNGSENFASGSSRYGIFPSASVGYVLTAEPFMQSQKVLDHFKLRFSVGKVGSDVGVDSRFMYMDGVWNPTGDYFFGVNNTNGSNYYTLGVPGNKDVTWETAVKYNLGIDLKGFDNRLTVTADAFFEDRTGILITPNSTPSIIATALPDLNIGEVENFGYEIAVSWSDSFDSGFRYSLDANASFARNKIIYMDEVMSKFSYQNQTGGSTGSYSDLYQFVRLYTDSDFDSNGDVVQGLPRPAEGIKVYPGDAMYADLSGDGIVNGDDKMTTGYSTRPEYIFGLNGMVEYKGVSFSMQWTGATNVNKMMEIEYRIPFTNAGSRGLLDYFVEDAWNPERRTGTLPRASENSEVWNSEASTLWLRDASYLRLKTVSLGYTFYDSQVLKRIGISKLSLKLSAYNLFTFSPMDFEDPEAVASNEGDYPLVQTYDLGININF